MQTTTFLKYILFTCLFVLSTTLIAQNGTNEDVINFSQDSIDEEEEYEYYYPFEIAPYSIGLSPTAIVNVFPALQLSHDFRLGENTVFGLETGFVFTNAQEGKGFRLRGSLERYLYRNDIFGIYLGAAVTTVNMWDYIVYSVRFENEYFREFSTFQYRSLLGGYLTGGLKFHLGNGVLLELGGGLGLASLYNEPLEATQFVFGGNVFSSDPGWNPLLGFYTHMNVSTPINVEPVKNLLKGSKNKKKKKKRRRRGRRR